jgi:dienelactone hydrolase
MTTSALAGLDRSTFAHEGREHDVYRVGEGPAVIVIHEAPGLHPGVIDFGKRVADAGFTAVMPSLVGTPGGEKTGRAMAACLLRVCVSREFTTFATGRTSPIVGWLRALGAKAHEECGGPGIGAVGMCFTGGFALGMMVDERMLAPVLSQPSMPAPLGAKARAALDISPDDMAVVKRRAAAGACVLGLRFTGDGASPPERFETLRRELGDAFIGVEIDSSEGNPYGNPGNAHSVLTTHLVDEPGHPTRQALDLVLAHFTRYLRP